MHKLSIKRVYKKPEKADGFRILVDRLWPRGVSKSEAAVDLWLKDVAPSTDLRVWFNHEPEKFKDFSKKYTLELKHNPAVHEIEKELQKHNVTLIYAAKDPNINHAAVLCKFITDSLKKCL